MRADVVIDGYEDFERLGAGGFSTVYRAHQVAFDRTVAVKVLTVTLDAKAQRRFERECRATGRLSGHPHIVTVLDAGLTADGRPYLTTELLERGSLGDWIASHGAMPTADVVRIGVEMCGALAAVHDAGILHRDLKPENVLVSAYGEPRLADFGISAVGMEATGSTMTFTPVHAPPEVLEGLPPAPTMDIYSLASTLWTLAVGRPPFELGDEEALLPFIRRVMTEPVPALPAGPAALDEVLRRAMAKDPAERFETATAFGEALQGVQGSLGQPVTPMSREVGEAAIPVESLLAPMTAPATAAPRDGRRRPVVVAAAAVVVVVALVVTGVALAGGDDPGGGTSAVDAGTAAATPALVTAPPAEGGKLTVGLPGQVSSLNPTQLGFTYSNQVVAGAVVETLTAVRDGEVVPYLAESVEPADDGRRWTITLPDGVVFHDGSPLDGPAVADAVERLTKVPLIAEVMAPVAEVDAVDERTVVVTMSTPWAGFPATLATGGSAIVSPSWWADTDQPPIGTGPFRVAEPPSADGIVLVRNDRYRLAGLPHLDELAFAFLPDEAERRAALERGDVDLLLTTEATTAEALEEDHPLLRDVQSVVDGIVLNHAAPPFDDERMRRAVALATDGQALADEMEGGMAEPATAPLSPSSPWVPEDVGQPEVDLDRATELVEAYEAEHGPVTVELTSVGDPDVRRLADRVARMWERIGIDVDTVSMAQQELTSAIGLGRTQAALFGFVSAGDPDGVFTFFHSSTSAPPGSISINLPHLSSPEVDTALDAGRATLDPSARREAYAELFRALNEQVAAVWLITEPFAMVVGPQVAGLTPDMATDLARPMPNGWAARIGVAP